MYKAFPSTQMFYRNYLIHKMVFKPSIAFYVIKEEKREVHILRVLREEEDWKKTLSAESFYTYPKT